MRDIPKLVVAVVLFIVILFTFVVTLKTIGQSRYFHPSPETVYLDLGTQTVQASVAIVPPAQAAPPEATNG